MKQRWVRTPPVRELARNCIHRLPAEGRKYAIDKFPMFFRVEAEVKVKDFYTTKVKDEQ
jgi:hypothetical protein